MSNSVIHSWFSSFGILASMEELTCEGEVNTEKGREEKKLYY